MAAHLGSRETHHFAQLSARFLASGTSCSHCSALDLRCDTIKNKNGLDIKCHESDNATEETNKVCILDWIACPHAV